LFAMTDFIAERIRKIGGSTLRSIGHVARIQAAAALLNLERYRRRAPVIDKYSYSAVRTEAVLRRYLRPSESAKTGPM